MVPGGNSASIFSARPISAPSSTEPLIIVPRCAIACAQAAAKASAQPRRLAYFVAQVASALPVVRVTIPRCPGDLLGLDLSRDGQLYFGVRGVIVHVKCAVLAAPHRDTVGDQNRSRTCSVGTA